MKSTIKKNIQWVAIIALVLSVLEAVNFITARSLNNFSIYPRDFDTLLFIFSAPFLHADFSHYLSNVFTLCLFAFLLLQYGQRRFVYVSFGIIVLTGLFVWLFGRNAYHLGASGVVYGYFGYLVLAGILSKRLSLIFISLLIAFLYGGIIWGVLPMRDGVSWESHLFGFLSGLVLAYIWRNQVK